MSRKGVVRHIDVVRRQDITNIFLCKVIYFLIKKKLILRENYQKTKFCANKYKKCIIYRKYTDIIQAEEKQKKKRTKTKTTSLDTPP